MHCFSLHRHCCSAIVLNPRHIPLHLRNKSNSACCCSCAHMRLTILCCCQGLQELHKAAPQAAGGGGEADPETQQAVQRVFNLVRNGASSSNESSAKGCNLTLDDVVRFYNVSPAPPALDAPSTPFDASRWHALRSEKEGVVRFCTTIERQGAFPALPCGQSLMSRSLGMLTGRNFC